jgi:hypothetical protein
MAVDRDPSLRELLLAYLAADARYRAVEQQLVTESIQDQSPRDGRGRLEEMASLSSEREARRREWIAALEERLGHPREADHAIPIRGEDYPVLAAIWDNDDDAVYDEL